MVDRDRAMKIVNILAENLKIPVTVKTRLGWNGAEELVEFWQVSNKLAQNSSLSMAEPDKQEYMEMQIGSLCLNSRKI
jgi:hypothetical protein